MTALEVQRRQPLSLTKLVEASQMPPAKAKGCKPGLESVTSNTPSKVDFSEQIAPDYRIRWRCHKPTHTEARRTPLIDHKRRCLHDDTIRQEFETLGDVSDVEGLFHPPCLALFLESKK